MTDTLKVLGQNTPSANTATTLYTVPSSTSTVVSSITVCNTNTTDVKIRVWVQVAGASDTTKQYIYYDVTVAGNETIVMSAGISLATTDVIRIQADTTNVAFSAFGVEIT